MSTFNEEVGFTPKSFVTPSYIAKDPKELIVSPSELEDELAPLKTKDSELTDDVNVNKENININKEDIASNKEDINVNKENIASNREDINVNREDIDVNKENIASNREDINVNREDIDVNKENIASNREDIDSVTARVNTMLENAPEAFDTLKEVADAINDLGQRKANKVEVYTKEEVYTKDETDNKLNTKLNISTFSTKTSEFTTFVNLNFNSINTQINTVNTSINGINTILESKVTKDIFNDSITNINNKLSDRYVKSEVYTKSETKNYVKGEIAALVDNAPETLDTLKEVADALKEGNDALEALNANVYSKEYIDNRVSDINTQFNEINTKITDHSSEFEELKSNVTDIDSALTSVSNDLNEKIETRATIESLNALTTVVNNKTDQTDFNALSNTVNNKADKSVVDELQTNLDTKASQAEVNGLSSSVTEIQTALETKANTTDLEPLNTSVDAINLSVSFIISALNDKVDNTSLEELTDVVNAKANAADVYTKDKADDKFITEHQSLADYATVDSLSDYVTSENFGFLDGRVNDIVNTLEALENKINILTNALSKANVEVSSLDNGVDVYDDTEMNYSLYGTLDAAPLTVFGKSVSLTDADIANNSRVYFHSPSVEIENTALSGEYQRKINGVNKNSVININDAADVVIKDLKVDDVRGNIYNGIEIGLNQGTLPKKVLIENCQFNYKFDNNVISVFGTQDDAVIDIVNCKFGVLSNALRISNTTNNKCTINFKNCEFKNLSEGHNGDEYVGIVICQDYTSNTDEVAESNNLFSKDKITINIINCTNNGELITAPSNIEDVCGTKNDNQLLYVYRNKGGFVNYDEDKYPTLNIEG